GGVAIEIIWPNGELDEVPVRIRRAGHRRHAKAEVHPAGGVGGHIKVLLLGNRMDLPIEVPVDLAVRIVTIGLVDELDHQNILSRWNSGGVSPESAAAWWGGGQCGGGSGCAARTVSFELEQRIAIP